MGSRCGVVVQDAEGVEDELEGVVVAVHRDWWRWLRWLGDGVMSESGWRLLMWRFGLCGDAEVVLGGCLSRDRERSRGIK